MAVDSGVLDRLIVSTNDLQVARIARGLELEVPFRRPEHLSTDRTPMVDVALHALDALEVLGDRFDALLLLQPTSPLRTAGRLQEAVRLLNDHPEASAVCSVTPVPPELCPHYLMRIDGEGWLRPFMPDGDRYTRRQDVPPAHRRCGTVFLTRVEVLQNQRSFYGKACLPLEVPLEEGLNIDGPDDWAEAERQLRHGQEKTA